MKNIDAFSWRRVSMVANYYSPRIRRQLMFYPLISLVAFALIVYALVSYFTGNVVSGWASSLIVTCFLGGIQLISLGVIGEYVGKIYMETKARPRFIISERTEEKQ